MASKQNFLQKIMSFIMDEKPQEEQKSKKIGIEEKAANRVKALEGRWEIVEGQVKLAAQSRRELQKLSAEAKATKALGLKYMSLGNTVAAESAQARYAVLQETIQQMVIQAKSADGEATNALAAFKNESTAARRSVSEAKVLAQLETVMDLQKKRNALEITYTTAADEFEDAKEALLLESSVQAATAQIQLGTDQLSSDVKALQAGGKILEIGNQWQAELEQMGGVLDAEFEIVSDSSDAVDEADEFLAGPAFGGFLTHGTVVRPQPKVETVKTEPVAEEKAEEAADTAEAAEENSEANSPVDDKTETESKTDE